jgi:hypothetical protein
VQIIIALVVTPEGLPLAYEVLPGNTANKTTFDIVADSDYALPESASIGKIRTTLGVPLLREGVSIGVFWLARRRVDPFSERQIEFAGRSSISAAPAARRWWH